MKAFTLWIWFVFSPCLLAAKLHIVTNKDEARAAFTLLNDIRAHPAKYRHSLHLGNISDITQTPLNWNDTLAHIAEQKARDMATRTYFSHVDPDGNGINYLLNAGGYWLNKAWLRHRSDNFFESICMGVTSGAEAINGLIIDENVPSLSHRKHLLGMGDWNVPLRDIGIGFVKREDGEDWETYVCIIIARHDW